ncbi:MAG TPA: IPT/TIG domain-containing protein [Candidatus Ozemobacteraceae bacterium]|nr:IPT/TIG domain-containing protein [Candidatus Ozemobacteraceae bacterium]
MILSVLLAGCGGGGGGGGNVVPPISEADAAQMKAAVNGFIAALQSSNAEATTTYCSQRLLTAGTLGVLTLKDLEGRTWEFTVPADGVTLLSADLAILRAFIEEIEGYRIDLTFRLAREGGRWYIDDITLQETPVSVEKPAPTVTAINPATGVNTGDLANVTITGTGFQSGVTVQLTRTGQNPIQAKADSTVIADDGKTITCTFPLANAAVGSWNLVITNPDGKSVTGANLFVVTSPAPSPEPLVSNVTPGSGSNNGSVNITVIGENFVTGATVKLTLGQLVIQAQNVVVAADGQSLTCTLPLAQQETGEWTFTVTNPDNQSNDWGSPFLVEPPEPFITSVSPSVGENDGPVNITISGVRFQTNATVTLSKSDTTLTATTVIVDGPTQIRCTLPITGAQLGEYSLTVTNPDSLTTSTSFMVVPPSPPPPTISNIFADTDNITAIGSGFQAGATMRYRLQGDEEWTAATDVTILQDGNTLNGRHTQPLLQELYEVEVTNPGAEPVVEILDLRVPTP